MCKVFLYGDRKVGKTTIINRLLESLAVMPSGFRTVSNSKSVEGDWELFIVGTNEKTTPNDTNGVAKCNADGSWESYPEVFDIVGTGLLSFNSKPDIVVMDELGFMEQDALIFQKKVLDVLDSPSLVIGVVKPSPNEFTRKIFEHPNVETFEVTTENRDKILSSLIEKFKKELLQKSKKTAGLILAAGYSSRMREIKALLDFGGKTVIKRQIECFRSVGIKDIYVVLGHEADMISGAIKDCDVNIVINENYQNGMFSSVQVGIRAVYTSGADGVFISPVDNPLMQPYTLITLLDRFNKSENNIFYPCFNNKKGHPPLIRKALFDDILNYSGDDGLKGVFKKHSSSAEYIEMGNATCLMDIDTKQDYLNALEYYNNHKVPDKKEIEYLYIKCGVSAKTVAHCKKVAETGKAIAEGLADAGYETDPEIIFAGGLLHDINKGSEQHAKKAAEILTALGYSELAEIVRNHMDLDIMYQTKLCDASILYLADKLVKEDKLTGIDSRARLNSNDNIKAKAENRLDIARRIQQMAEEALGTKLTCFLNFEGAE